MHLMRMMMIIDAFDAAVDVFDVDVDAFNVAFDVSFDAGVGLLVLGAGREKSVLKTQEQMMCVLR